MKGLLQFFGVLFGLLGALGGGYAIATGLGLSNPLLEPSNALVTYGVAYVVTGAAFATLFFAVAEILGRLERQ